MHMDSIPSGACSVRSVVRSAVRYAPMIRNDFPPNSRKFRFRTGNVCPKRLMVRTVSCFCSPAAYGSIPAYAALTTSLTGSVFFSPETATYQW